MRESYHYRYALKPPEIPQYMQKILETELQDFLKQREEERRKQEEEATRVQIDFSQLAHIREAAAITREKLLVDEAEEPAPEPVSPEPAPAPPASAPVSEDSLLTPLEVQFLQCLFDHTSCEALCRKHGRYPPWWRNRSTKNYSTNLQILSFSSTATRRNSSRTMQTT